MTDVHWGYYGVAPPLAHSIKEEKTARLSWLLYNAAHKSGWYPKIWPILGFGAMRHNVRTF